MQSVKAEGFIWLIVGAFWVIAQIAGAAAKKKTPLRPAESTNDSVDPFAELMRKMAGVQPVDRPQSQYQDEQEAALAATETMPDIEPLRREPMGQEKLHPEPSAVAEIDIRPTMKAFRNTLPAMKLPTMRLSFQPLEKTAGKVPTLGNVLNPADQKSLRRAMLSHILFSPPKALE